MRRYEPIYWFYNTLFNFRLLKVLKHDNDQNTEIALSILSLPVYSGRMISPINEINP